MVNSTEKMDQRDFAFLFSITLDLCLAIGRVILPIPSKQRLIRFVIITLGGY